MAFNYVTESHIATSFFKYSLLISHSFSISMNTPEILLNDHYEHL